MIRNGIGEISPLSILNLVDDLQRLGVSYYFVNEISNVLENVYNNYYKNHEDWIKMDLNLKSLGFRLLRQHGYHIPQEIFKDVIDENGNVNGPFYEDVVGMLNLYEASYHSVEDESILDDARTFTEKYLKEIIEKMSDKNMLSLISHALAFPLHWIPPRVESMWFIEMYETRLIGMNPEVLEFAKLDYNMGQAVHQEDLKYVSRGDLTKVNAMITTIVDVYDVYGTLQELEQFTNVMNRFSSIVPSVTFFNFDIQWQDLSHSYIIEARWFSSGYTPTFEEFVNNAYMSIGIMPIIKHAYVLSLTSVSEDALKRIGRAENMMRSASLIVRLTNDMGTSSDELERGDVPKSIQCYMLESGATEVEAREYIKKLIMETWKKMNKERQAIVSEFPREFLDCVTNLARMGHFMYTDGDKHGKPDMFKPYALSLFVNPIKVEP
ncbi:hypothetical protein L1987_81638 [Smallanthus sonchifolius]|uniref:Uncharacterized protein n=1 Tax=Smallanthus sonchifolius TaxID=185202 RepID=A0ACB8YS34_9ASTR|nr:hypothetical protein L1987_81638 [Smallanthus sonchifolius]